MRLHRLQHGLHQRHLARASGVSLDYISKCELGTRRPNAKVIIVLEMIFGIPGAEIFPDFYQERVDEMGRAILVILKKLEKRNDEQSQKAVRLLSSVTERLPRTELV